MTADSTFYDLSSFPPPEAVEEISAEAIIAAMKTEFLGLAPEFTGVINLESEPVHKIFQVCAYRETLVRARINDAIRANLLRYAKKADLDHLAAFYDVVRLPGELDPAFQRRVILAIQGRSPGGTAPRYRAAALGADIRVADAEVYREGTSPLVHVAIFATDNNGIADAALLQTVRDTLNAPGVRMVSDTIIVEAASYDAVDIEADIWLLPETPDTLLLPATPEAESPLVTQLRAAWADESGLGFDLVREWLSARLMVAGVHKVGVISPSVDLIAPPHRAIALGRITLNHRGRGF